MRIIPLATVAAALIMNAPASAQGNSQAAATAATAATPGAKAKEEKKVCKLLQTSGTRMAERVCLTKEEWKKVEQQLED